MLQNRIVKRNRRPILQKKMVSSSEEEAMNAKLIERSLVKKGIKGCEGSP
jgi:hypothetical protein